MSKTYLGDSVYVDTDFGSLKLTTENELPDDPSNIIFLEPEVMEALIRYYKREELRTVIAANITGA